MNRREVDLVIPGRAKHEPGIHIPCNSVWMLTIDTGVMDSGPTPRGVSRNDGVGVDAPRPKTARRANRQKPVQPCALFQRGWKVFGKARANYVARVRKPR